jgi:hypothetical protein
MKTRILIALLVALLEAPTVHAQTDQTNLKRLDTVMSQTMTIQTTLGPHAKFLSGAARNLLNIASKWDQIGPMLGSQGSTSGLSPSEETAIFSSITLIPVTVPEIGSTRLSGFTQSETSTAWCTGSTNSNAVVAFNDSGSAIATMAGLLSTGASFEGYAYSSDRGADFTEASPAYPSLYPGAWMLGDPTVACSDPNDFYYASIWYDYSSSGSLTQTGVSVARSTDGGVNFGTPVVAVALPYAAHLVDKPWMTIDPTSPSKLYVTYTDFDSSGSFCPTTGKGRFKTSQPGTAIELVSSSDGGLTWNSPTLIHEECGTPAVQGSQVAVGPRGQVYVAWERFNTNTSREIDIAQVTTSACNSSGCSFSKVSDVNYAGDSSDLQGAIRVVEFPSLGINGNGTLYVAWNDGTRSMPDSQSYTGAYQFTDVKVSSSSNGTAWSSPVTVNDNPGDKSDEFQPALAVDKGGTVAVCYYDRHNDPNNFLIERYCATSSNGSSWSTTAVAAPASGLPPGWPSVVNQDIMVASDYMGDYDTLAADVSGTASGFVGAFGDNSLGNPNVQGNTLP